MLLSYETVFHLFCQAVLQQNDGTNPLVGIDDVLSGKYIEVDCDPVERDLQANFFVEILMSGGGIPNQDDFSPNEIRLLEDGIKHTYNAPPLCDSSFGITSNR